MLYSNTFSGVVMGWCASHSLLGTWVLEVGWFLRNPFVGCVKTSWGVRLDLSLPWFQRHFGFRKSAVAAGWFFNCSKRGRMEIHRPEYKYAIPPRRVESCLQTSRPPPLNHISCPCRTTRKSPTTKSHQQRQQAFNVSIFTRPSHRIADLGRYQWHEPNKQ